MNQTFGNVQCTALLWKIFLFSSWAGWLRIVYWPLLSALPSHHQSVLLFLPDTSTVGDSAAIFLIQQWFKYCVWQMYKLKGLLRAWLLSEISLLKTVLFYKTGCQKMVCNNLNFCCGSVSFPEVTRNACIYFTFHFRTSRFFVQNLE